MRAAAIFLPELFCRATRAAYEVRNNLPSDRCVSTRTTESREKGLDLFRGIRRMRECAGCGEVVGAFFFFSFCKLICSLFSMRARWNKCRNCRAVVERRSGVVVHAVFELFLVLGLLVEGDVGSEIKRGFAE